MEPPVQHVGQYRLGEKVGRPDDETEHVYKGRHVCTGEEVAVKLLPGNTRRQAALTAEVRALKKLYGNPGIPRLRGYGMEKGTPWLALDLLGPDLNQLLARCGGRFSLKTTLMLGEQLVRRLEWVHSRGLLHRDIKPRNVCVGARSDSTRVYLVDFETAGAWWDPKARNHIPLCKNLTAYANAPKTYASIHKHELISQSRRDDVESLAYVLVACVRGGLPWADNDNREMAIFEKMKMTPEDLCEGLPLEFTRFLQHARGLTFTQRPNYRHLRHLLKACFLREVGGKTDWDFVFDWMPTSARRGRLPHPDSAAMAEAPAGGARAQSASHGAGLQALVAAQRAQMAASVAALEAPGAGQDAARTAQQDSPTASLSCGQPSLYAAYLPGAPAAPAQASTAQAGPAPASDVPPPVPPASLLRTAAMRLASLYSSAGMATNQDAAARGRGYISAVHEEAVAIAQLTGSCGYQAWAPVAGAEFGGEPPFDMQDREHRRGLAAAASGSAKDPFHRPTGLTAIRTHGSPVSTLNALPDEDASSGSASDGGSGRGRASVDSPEASPAQPAAPASPMEDAPTGSATTSSGNAEEAGCYLVDGILFCSSCGRGHSTKGSFLRHLFKRPECAAGARTLAATPPASPPAAPASPSKSDAAASEASGGQASEHSEGSDGTVVSGPSAGGTTYRPSDSVASHTALRKQGSSKARKHASAALALDDILGSALYKSGGAQTDLTALADPAVAALRRHLSRIASLKSSSAHTLLAEAPSPAADGSDADTWLGAPVPVPDALLATAAQFLPDQVKFDACFGFSEDFL